jgi:hypothetical protein
VTPYPPAEPFTRSTLQFYSSPRIRLLPLPVYKNRHTAHYIAPDHFARLAVICVLREKFFMPIKLIQKLIEVMPGDRYQLLEKWPGTMRDLLQAAPLLQKGFKEEDLIRFAVIKTLIFNESTPAEYRSGIEMFISFEDEHLKNFLRGQIDKHARELEKWAAAGPAASYVKELAKSIGGFSNVQEWVEKTRGSKKFSEKAAAEREEKPRLHPR